MNTTPTYRIAIAVSALGAVLHLYENLAKSTEPSVGWFLWALVPYVLCLAVWARSGTGAPALAGVLLALALDLYMHYGVFIHPTSSTAALGMIFIPLWSAILVCPVAMLLAWLAVRRRSPVRSDAP